VTTVTSRVERSFILVKDLTPTNKHLSGLCGFGDSSAADKDLLDYNQYLTRQLKQNLSSIILEQVPAGQLPHFVTVGFAHTCLSIVT
jgi:hypothetical protein